MCSVFRTSTFNSPNFAGKQLIMLRYLEHFVRNGMISNVATSRNYMYCSSAFMQKLSSAFILQRMIYNNGCRDQGLKNRYNRQRDSSLIYIVFSGLKTILNFIKLTVKQHFKLKISFISCNNEFFLSKMISSDLHYEHILKPIDIQT